MNAFSFTTSQRIEFGWGQLAHLASWMPSGVSRLAVLCGSRVAQCQDLLAPLQQQGFELAFYPVTKEPDVQMAQQLLAEVANFAPQAVIGLGGGSVIDLGKVVAIMLRQQGPLLDYLEVVGAGRQIEQPGLPYIAIPSTAGTGAEVTRNAVLDVPEQGVKVSLRSPWMLPSLALIDPQLTLSLPASVTASTGMDALTQVIEPYVSAKANPLTDALALAAIEQAAWALPRLRQEPDSRPAREAMAYVSLSGGLALANSGLGAVHGLAGPLGGMLGAPHGMLCAALLAPVMRANINQLRQQSDANSQAGLARYQRVAALLTGQPDARAEQGVEWVEQCCQHWQIPSLTTWGLTPARYAEAVSKGQRASSMKANWQVLEDHVLTQVLVEASAI
ncbi:iron-containing alcohol dehydrogenase [Balneatrix alpica]|uniref:Iron-containing alcohol dehydrogenase n=1 Tax=Balneatrix alpica TaxID=75684 RepID=A0ABV5ZCY2_9GAMM|nr:iron-containing alcohol dehydrogenase [Balneatrix alpica]